MTLVIPNCFKIINLSSRDLNSKYQVLFSSLINPFFLQIAWALKKIFAQCLSFQIPVTDTKSSWFHEASVMKLCSESTISFATAEISINRRI